MIIVAIENTDRNRDMMPVIAKDLPGPPRAEAFLGFLEKELIPDIENAYRTAQPRILQGKSLSGLFTIYALLARPTVFNAYVGCSAGWFTQNNDYFLGLGRRAFQTVESLPPGEYSWRTPSGIKTIPIRRLSSRPVPVSLRRPAVCDNGDTEEVTSHVCSRCDKPLRA